MFKEENLPLETSPSQPQPSVSTHEYLIEIENLKESQRINNESIQFLADSISQISSTISHLQASNISNHNLTKEKPESSRQDQYPDCPSLDHSIVHSQSPSSITFSKDNNNEHNDLRKSESSHDKNQVIDLTESTSVLPHLDPLQTLPYAKVVQANSQSQSPATNTLDLLTKPAEKVKTKEIFQQNHQHPYPNHPMDLLEGSGKKEEIINISSYPALLKTSMKIKSIRILWKEMLRRIT